MRRVLIDFLSLVAMHDIRPSAAPVQNDRASGRRGTPRPQDIDLR
jgi:hypothetical protein